MELCLTISPRVGAQSEQSFFFKACSEKHLQLLSRQKAGCVCRLWTQQPGPASTQTSRYCFGSVWTAWLMHWCICLSLRQQHPLKRERGWKTCCWNLRTGVYEKVTWRRCFRLSEPPFSPPFHFWNLCFFCLTAFFPLFHHLFYWNTNWAMAVRHVIVHWACWWHLTSFLAFWEFGGLWQWDV